MRGAYNLAYSFAILAGHVSVASIRKIIRRKRCVQWYRGVGENPPAVDERLDLVFVPESFS